MKLLCFVVACIVLLGVHSSIAQRYFQPLCHYSQHSCSGIKKCVPLVKVCDGKDDCGDNSDETRCALCHRSQHTCRGIKKCVPLAKVCDGKNDCGDNSDEIGCGWYGRRRNDIRWSRYQHN